MKKIIRFVTKKFKEIYVIHLWWHFKGKRIQREYEEEQQKEAEQQGKNLEEYYLAQADEEIRKGEERYWSDLEQRGFDTAYWKKLDKEK